MLLLPLTTGLRNQTRAAASSERQRVPPRGINLTRQTVTVENQTSIDKEKQKVDNQIDDYFAQLHLQLVADMTKMRLTFQFEDSATSPEPVSFPVSQFLDRLYSLCRSEATQEAAIDFVYSHLSRLLSRGDLEECDWILASIDVHRAFPSVHASILTITSGATKVLTERSAYYDRVLAFVTELRGPVKAKRILVGLA